MAIGLKRSWALWAGVLLLFSRSVPVEAHNGAVAIAVPVEGITIDGDLSDWLAGMRRYPIALSEYEVPPRDAQDFQASFRIGYNGQENALYVGVEVQDESTVVDASSAAKWDTQDGCELVVDSVNRGWPREVCSAVNATGQRVYPCGAAGHPIDAGSEGVAVAVQREGGQQRYEWRMDVGVLGQGEMLVSGRAVGLEVVVRDQDEDGSFTLLAWASARKERYVVGLGDVMLVDDYAQVSAISGKVTHAQDGSPWGGAMVRIEDRATRYWIRSNPGEDGWPRIWTVARQYSATTDSEGHYEVTVWPDTYRVWVVGAVGTLPAVAVVNAGEPLDSVDIAPTGYDARQGNVAGTDDFGTGLGGWRYHAGDDSSWAASEWADSLWVEQYRTDSRRPDWNGIGWFRLHVAVDSTLWNRPFALQWAQKGASEIYLDGKLLCALGKVGLTRKEEVVVPAFQGDLSRGPSAIKAITFGKGTDHVIAIRHSDFSLEGVGPYGGFALGLGDLRTDLDELVLNDYRRQTETGNRMLFAGVALALAFLHLLLFLFYPRATGNLYYAAFAGIIAVWGSVGETGGADWELMLLILVCCLRLLYYLFYPRVPRRFWFFLAALCLVWLDVTIRHLSGTLTTRSFWLGSPTVYGLLSSIVILIKGIATVLSFAEMLRVVVMAIIRRKEGAWLVGVGLLALCLGLFVRVGGFGAFGGSFRVPTGGLPFLGEVLAFLFSWGWVVAFLLMMSVNLARNVARTSRNLETQLVQVQELSAKTLEQERALREEAEKELQTAHDLQMGLMPQEAPRLSDLEVAGRCLPANHVGGDLFQYFHTPDKLSIALADVTGHAMEAAIPVVMFCGVLRSQLELGSSLEALFDRLNRSLHATLSGHTFICFTLGELELNSRRLRLSNSGCPYPYHYRAATDEVVELRVNAYPLGIRPDTVYPVIEVQLEPGDRVVFCSDGIVEAANGARELFGFERLAGVIEAGCRAGLPATGLLERVFAAVQGFAGDVPQGDDQTVVVLKVEGEAPKG